MKKFLLGTIALMSLAAPAAGADLAARPYTKAPPMIAAAYDWTGFYLGANAGWGTSHVCRDLTNDGGIIVNPAVSEGCHNASGATAGGQIGYRTQSAAWVFGIEAQGNWADFKGSNNSLVYLPPPGINNRTKIDAFGLVTGQVGYAVNNALFYVKGGAAVTNNKYEGYTILPTAVASDRASETRWGAAVGVGAEYAFAPNWSVGIEYDHLFMGSRDINMYSTGLTGFGGPAGTFLRTDRVKEDVDLITVRVNYRWGGPVIAKY